MTAISYNQSNIYFHTSVNGKIVLQNMNGNISTNRIQNLFTGNVHIVRF